MKSMQQILKEKEAKRNSKALSLKDKRTKGSKGSKAGDRVTQMSNADKREQKANKRAQELVQISRSRSLQAAEIDEYLIGLVMSGMIDEGYWKFHTKCVYTLGFQNYHQLVIEARSGNKPRNLLAFKLKGAITLHYKKKYIADDLDLLDD